MVDEERETILSLNDFHVPYHDPRAIEVAFSFAKFIKPHRLIIHELLDWYSLSKFNKDPNRKLDLQKDLNVAIDLLGQLRKTLPDTPIIMIQSNHDRRLQKYLDRHAEELYNLDVLKIENLLHLKDFNITYREDYTFRNVLFKHGSVVRQNSGYTAKAELDREGVSGCSGHTHRLAAHFRTLRGGSYVWLETGCLCDLSPEYIDIQANWQSGLGGFIFRKNSKHFYPFIVPIIDGEIFWGNKTFK